MSVEELLKPRFEVIADYPDSEHAVGDIITLAVTDPEDKWQRVMVKKWETIFPKYPHLFKELKWWEKRKISELPSYVSHNVVDFKAMVRGWVYENGYCFVLLDSGEEMDVRLFSPATEQEYRECAKNK